MGPKKSSSSEAAATAKVNARGEVLQIRSPAEFFAENQNIAGFDNPGKSLYTTIREFVENGLDAAESIEVLPSISLSVVEMNQKKFNEIRGVKEHVRIDHDLYNGPTTSKKRKSFTVETTNTTTTTTTTTTMTKTKTTDSPPAPSPEASPSAASLSKKGEVAYYKITCKDNGVGMAHDKIPDMLGRDNDEDNDEEDDKEEEENDDDKDDDVRCVLVVLSGSKYGVRQTRGKFGLGAKMALIWAKKSTGVPIEVKTAHCKTKDGLALHTSYCKLDIDINKNEPNILEHRKLPNKDDMRGTEISVIISGNWTTYKSRVIQYLQQLAIITPYAEFDLTYECTFNEKRNFSIHYERRSDQMPPLAREVKHHPSALNDLLMGQLISNSKHATLSKFLTKDLSSIDAKLSARVIAELGPPFDEQTNIREINSKQIHRLVQLLKQVEFKPPDGKSLSPAGEYNLRLGIIKELNPDLVATFTEAPAVFEGHAFIVEAGVSIGGKNAREGVNVYRFANRIPLLFEAGGDVATRTAMKQINWSAYKIDHKRDKIGVFVSIVSTKIPFKGTGKEYIGDDIQEMKKAVKRVLQQCCSQLRNKLLKHNRLKENNERKRNLTKYIPDIARSVFGVLSQMKDRDEAKSKKAKLAAESSSFSLSSAAAAGMETTAITSLTAQSTNMNLVAAKDSKFLNAKATFIQALDQGDVSDAIIRKHLNEAVQKADDEAALEQITAAGRDMGIEQKVYIPSFDESKVNAILVYHPCSVFQIYSTVLRTN